jgi:alanine-glyoxylate transaminase/serine-glyoxylate transaminase/serine-pyruvate transaminase
MIRRGRPLIQLPGPTNIPDRVLRAMHRVGEDFAAPEFTVFARTALDELKRIVLTEGEIFAFAAVGHGAWELALQNLVGPGESVLIPEAGRFSESWREMCRALEVPALKVPGDWRRPVDANAVDAVLRDDVDRTIKAVLAVHVETSTGIAHDVGAIRAALDRTGHPALLVVDAIASLACVPLPMDELGLDVVLAASQKGLMLPPGLCFAAVGPRALAVAETGGMPRRYWDWRPRRGAHSYEWFYGTPPVQMLHGLRASLDMIFEETLAGVHARHRRLAEAARAAVARWAEAGALEFQCVEPVGRSDTITAIRFADGLDPEALRRLCRDRFSVSFGGGLGELHGKVLRIGHLGDLNEAMLLGALAVLETVLALEDVPHARGGVEAASASLATGEGHDR